MYIYISLSMYMCVCTYVVLVCVCANVYSMYMYVHIPPPGWGVGVVGGSGEHETRDHRDPIQIPSTSVAKEIPTQGPEVGRPHLMRPSFDLARQRLR